MSSAVSMRSASTLSLSGTGDGLTIDEALLCGNSRIEIISGDGIPTSVPAPWRPVLRDSDVLVAVPDMHMFLYRSNLDNFKFGAEAMLSFLQHLTVCRRQLAARGARLHLYQLGDMYELCFPHPRHSRAVSMRDIRRSHPIYEEIIRRFHELGFRYIVGNHDSEHRMTRGGMVAARDGSVYLEHGYTADRWFHFSNPNHRHGRLSMKALRLFRRWEARTHRVRGRIGNWSADCHAAVGIHSGDVERKEITAAADYPRRPQQHFAGLIRQSATPIRICLTAHTHRPYLDPAFAGGDCMFLDAGAWTEGRTDFVVVTNAEAAVCRYGRAAGQSASFSAKVAG